MKRLLIACWIIVVGAICCEGLEANTNVNLRVYCADNILILRTMPACSVDLIYIDPPFNTGRRRERKRFQLEEGSKLSSETLGYDDKFQDYRLFLEPRMREAYRVLKPTGSLFLHLDYREVHYVKVMLDEIFGRASFINEIIWVYDFGGRSKTRWSPKHDNILWYAKDPKNYTYNYEVIDRIPYMAPGLVGKEKARQGKTPTDVWWNTIVSPTGNEKTGYPTQKPRAIIDRIVKVHSNPGDVCLDFFAGSGTLGESAVCLGRRAILIDINKDAIEVMKKRFEKFNVEWKTEGE